MEYPDNGGYMVAAYVVAAVVIVVYAVSLYVRLQKQKRSPGR
jgi:hypothetical protein